jgi:hypothetical protein
LKCDPVMPRVILDQSIKNQVVLHRVYQPPNGASLADEMCVRKGRSTPCRRACSCASRIVAPTAISRLTSNATY